MSKKKKIEDVCVSMDDLHLICATLCIIRWLSVQLGIGWEEIKVCDAFWKQEMRPWSNAPPGLRNPFSKTYF